ncbi:MAG: hypothetical protein WA885_20445 [Phormidesmis sp.]
MAKLAVVICPGFHDAELTARFVRSLPAFVQPYVVKAFPADPLGVFCWLVKTIGSPQAKDAMTIVAIAFSGGVVGLAGAIALWQQQGGQVSTFVAIDGWGVPIIGMPVCRMSHDSFTHWSTLPLGSGQVNFYADPAVEHLQMWRDCTQVKGWQVGPNWQKEPMTAAEFLRRQLYRQAEILL